MKPLLVILMIVPFFADAQLNRSANELAKENVFTFLTLKIFKNEPWHITEYGKLNPYKEEHSDISWQLVCKAELEAIDNTIGRSISKKNSFVIYLDKKLRVLNVVASLDVAMNSLDKKGNTFKN